MSALTGKLGLCEVCNARVAKYTCPRCEVKTCCLACVNIHKKELNCNGNRNTVAYKSIASFTNLDLQSDYRLLEDITRSVENYSKESYKHYSRHNKELPVHLYKLRVASTKRGTRLLYLPRNFSRHIENSTYLNWKTGLITWKVDWIFAQAGNIKSSDDRLPEDERLSVLASQYMDPERCPKLLRDHLQFYHSATLCGVLLLLKAEHICRADSRFYQLDPDLTLKRNLEGKTIIEFPTIYVVLKNHKDIYEVIDSDEEPEEEILEYKYQHNGPMSGNYKKTRKQKMNGNINSKNLLFNQCDSADGSSDDSDKCEKCPRLNNQECVNGTERAIDNASFPPYHPPKQSVNECASTSCNYSRNGTSSGLNSCL